ncbi:MAG: D-glycerate dehydrogenase [Gemmatimonadota bacterium]|nr:D-glycerate dehydrogenase [Gemmatimonadota bacterium]
MSKRVFVTRRIPDAGINLLRAHGADVIIGQSDEEKGLAPDEILHGVKAADVLLSLLTEPVTREVLDANPRLLGVANYAVGFNNVDVVAATALGIPVTNTPGVLTDTTADLTWALILGVSRRIVPAHEYMVAGRYKLWGPNLFLGADASPGGTGRRKALGIIGYGRIGAAVARRAVGFDMDVLAYDPHNPAAIAADASDPARHLRSVGLEELLRESDFVSLHPLLTPETRHMIGERELSMMKPGAYLINVARGPVVDEEALVRALRNHTIAGAALDVFEDEPAMKPGLAECDNALLVPHIASASQDTRDRMAVMAAENAIAHLEGRRAPNAVNPEVYDSPAYSARRSAPRA